MYSLFNEGAEQLYSEEGALVKSWPQLSMSSKILLTKT